MKSRTGMTEIALGFCFIVEITKLYIVPENTDITISKNFKKKNKNYKRESYNGNIWMPLYWRRS